MGFGWSQLCVAHDIVMHIIAIPVLSMELRPDKPIWTPSTDGQLTKNIKGQR